jgi:hypothetical protein
VAIAHAVTTLRVAKPIWKIFRSKQQASLLFKSSAESFQGKTNRWSFSTGLGQREVNYIK